MTPYPLDNTHRGTTSGVACHLFHSTTCTGRRRQVWHAHIGLRQHTLSDNVGRHMIHRPETTHTIILCQSWHARMILGQRTQSDDIERCMPLPLLGSTHNRMTSGVACHRRPWEAHIVERHRAWYAIIALGKHTRLDDVGRGTLSSPLDKTHDQTTTGVACPHGPWVSHTVGRRMPSSPLDINHDHTKSGVACHHRPREAYTIK